MELTPMINEYIEAHAQEAYDLLLELAQIPAPSNHEEKRAQFCKNWLEKQGAEGVYIDEALNVVYPVGNVENGPLMVFMAHSDVVFPDTDKLPLTVKDGKIYCPGIGDDTANAVALMMVAKYIAENKLQPKDCGVLLIINAGEEGLGDLKGSRLIMNKYGDRVREFFTFDAGPVWVVSNAVGSHRYLVEIDTEGGHSFSKFGNRNAIAYMASLINTLYEIKVPMPQTTYNVGTITGGTSVNTIAQHAEMLYEYRSAHREALEYMKQHFEAAIAFYKTKGIEVKVTQLGDRPCAADVDPQRHQVMKDRVVEMVKRHYNEDAKFCSGSTDCNIPLSMGIPALCVGCRTGAGAHTRDEYVDISSLKPGYYLAFDLILYHF